MMAPMVGQQLSEGGHGQIGEHIGGIEKSSSFYLK
jgi:hypothetical protein